MADYLLDTNILLLSAQNAARLSPAQASILADPAHTLHLSVASVLELAVLHRRGKFAPASTDLLGEVMTMLTTLGLQLLPISADHTWRSTTLPLLPDHNDPMDLLILAQALHEGLPLLSTDRRFGHYVPHGLRLVA